jgi:hypothetical protein
METNMARPWMTSDNDLLRSLAGRQPIAEIAKRLDRSVSATYVQASKLSISFRSERDRAKQLHAAADDDALNGNGHSDDLFAAV